jgi:hypothetical protein
MRCSRIVVTEIDKASDVDGFLAFERKPPSVQLAESGAQRARQNHPAKQLACVGHRLLGALR